MRKIFEDVAEEELALTDAARRLAEYGHSTSRGTPLAKSTMKRILSNETYWNHPMEGETYEGKFTRLVSPDCLGRSKVLKKRSKPRKRSIAMIFPFVVSSIALWGHDYGAVGARQNGRSLPLLPLHEEKWPMP